MPEPRITYKAKESTTCPLCGKEFHREDILTGGGRMNAGELTDELHRKYLPTQKYGRVFPLIYTISVCPRCWFAAFPRHFTLNETEVLEALDKTIGERKNLIRPLFDDIDFEQDRTLPEGICSYVLAAACYDHFPKAESPTFLSGLCFLRAGWLANDFDEVDSHKNYSYMARIFLRKAAFYYSEALRHQNEKTENIEEIPHFGPDIDRNYGFDGVRYIAGLLQLKYVNHEDQETRIRILKEAQTTVSQIVGMGESSRAKPSVFLDMGRALYKVLKLELQGIDAS